MLERTRLRMLEWSSLISVSSPNNTNGSPALTKNVAAWTQEALDVVDYKILTGGKLSLANEHKGQSMTRAALLHHHNGRGGMLDPIYR